MLNHENKKLSNKYYAKAIIYEYKKLDKTTFGEPVRTLEDALWQIYAKNYISELLSKYIHAKTKRNGK